jgi:hypothetical protein
MGRICRRTEFCLVPATLCSFLFCGFDLWMHSQPLGLAAHIDIALSCLLYESLVCRTLVEETLVLLECDQTG